MPRVSKRRRFIKNLRRRVSQRKSLLVMQMLHENDDSSSSSSGSKDSSSSSGSNDSSSHSGSNDIMNIDLYSTSSGSSSGDRSYDSSSISNVTACGLIYAAAAYDSANSRLKFTEDNRYLLPRGTYRKSNEDIFINDLNVNGERPGERPWMTEEEFKQKYRVSREALDHIYEKIKDHKVFKNKRGPRQLHPKHQLMVLLHYLGTEGSGANNPRQRDVFKFARGTAHNSRKRALKAILSLESEYYYWPDEDEREKISEQYKKNFNLPNCVGVIDGTLFPLLFAPQTKDAADYHGRKFPWSLTSIVVSDDKRRIRFYVSGYPGSAHDNRMWRRSRLKMNKEQYFVVYEYLIGDTAFDPSEVMVSAYKANPGFTEPEDIDECNFNTIISKPRASSEHVNGMWKGRFPWLRNIPNRIKGKKTLKRVLRYIHCTVILHNLLIDFGDEHLSSWEREDDLLSDIADPKRAPDDDEMLPEERMLYEGVPDNAPNDWRRRTVLEYLRETYDNFKAERRARRRRDGNGDVMMEPSIEAQHEQFFNRFREH